MSRRINLSSRIVVEKNICVFLQDLESNSPIELQVAHGEGKFVMSPSTLSQIEKNGQVVFRYVDPKGQPTQEYPFNPNGSPNAIAGITDPSGRILGLMPHPERSILKSQYPNWRRMGDFNPKAWKFLKEWSSTLRRCNTNTSPGTVR